MFDCEAVDLDYMDTAPIRLGTVVNISRPPSEVFAAIAHDPANWGEFFPGFDKSGRWLTPAPHGVGTSAPAFRAWVEDYRFDSDGNGGTALRIAIGGRGRLVFKLASPIMPRVFAPLMAKMGRNIERGRWFSKPPSGYNDPAPL
jgi:hypothetical protein